MDSFPVIFGAVAVVFAIGSIANGQLVGRFGISRVMRVAVTIWVAGSVLLLAVAVAASGRPSFWVFQPLLTVVLGMFPFIMPNLNSVSLEPMGELAGTAASLTSAFRLGAGAVLGGLVAATMEESLTPFVVALLVFGSGAAAAIVTAEAREPARCGASVMS